MKNNLLYSSFSRAIRPTDKKPLNEWACANVKIIDSATGSPDFSTDQAPWVIDIMKAIEDNDNREIVIIAPVGSGKTTIIEGLMPWIISEESGNTLYASQSDDKAKEWAETRLLPSLKMCEPAKALMPKDRHKVRQMQIVFPHMLMKIGGAGMGNLQSSSMRWVIGDEPWLWKQGRMKEARGRTHDRWNARVIFLSQAGVKHNVPWSDEMGNPDLHAAYRLTNQQRMEWTCECGESHPWEWKDFHYSEAIGPEGERDWKTIEESVKMVCPSCEREFFDEPSTRWFLTNGSRYNAQCDKGMKGHIGFTYTAMLVPWIKWGKLACEWVEANDAKKRGDLKPLRIFKQKRLCEFWDDDIGEKVDLIEGGYLSEQYLTGEKIDDEYHRIMTCDVQGSGGRHFWYVCRAYRKDGTSRLINCGMLESWQDIERTQERLNIRSSLVFIDGQYEGEEVKSWCRINGWNMLHGVDRKKFSHKSRAGRVEKCYSPSGKYRVDGKIVRYWNLGTEPLKDILYLFMKGEGLDWEVPEDVTSEYRRHMRSEVKKDKINARTKQVERRWIKTSQDNHMWDCEYMNLGAAMITGIISGFHEDKSPPPD